MVERDGNMRAGPVPNVKRATLEPIIYANIQRGSRISTDELATYKALPQAPYRHQHVNHSKGEYVRGDVHVNTAEGYWSRLKNSIRGTHVHVSEQHMWKYTAEFSFRFNMRKAPAVMFDRLLGAVALPRLTES